jgi:hypothetical protein
LELLQKKIQIFSPKSNEETERRIPLKLTLFDFKSGLISLNTKKDLLNSNFNFIEFNFVLDFEKLFVGQNPVHLFHKKSKSFEIKLKLVNLINNFSLKTKLIEETSIVLDEEQEQSSIFQNLFKFSPKEVYC